MSLNWTPKPYEYDGIGEIYTGPPRWSNGATPPTARGQKPFGNPVFFADGQPWDPNGPVIARDPWGLATACTGMPAPELDDVDASIGISSEGNTP